MPDYIYIPVPSDDLLQQAKLWNEGRRNKGKPEYVVRYRDPDGPAVLPEKVADAYRQLCKWADRKLGLGILRQVPDTDKLYVLAHSAWSQKQDKYVGIGSAAIKLYDAEDLARVLEAEGLPPTFVDLRVFSCFSGADTMTDANNQVWDDMWGKHQSFAGQLHSALKPKYPQIRVTGYLGYLDATHQRRDGVDKPIMDSADRVDYYNHAHKGVDLGDGTGLKRAKLHRVQYT